MFIIVHSKKQSYYIDSKLNKKDKLPKKSCEFDNEFNQSINIIMINELGIKRMIIFFELYDDYYLWITNYNPINYLNILQNSFLPWR